MWKVAIMDRFEELSGHVPARNEGKTQITCQDSVLQDRNLPSRNECS